MLRNDNDNNLDMVEQGIPDQDGVLVNGDQGIPVEEIEHIIFDGLIDILNFENFLYELKLINDADQDGDFRQDELLVYPDDVAEQVDNRIGHLNYDIMLPNNNDVVNSDEYEDVEQAMPDQDGVLVDPHDVIEEVMEFHIRFGLVESFEILPNENDLDVVNSDEDEDVEQGMPDRDEEVE